jgi:hypothetical protein
MTRLRAVQIVQAVPERQFNVPGSKFKVNDVFERRPNRGY